MLFDGCVDVLDIERTHLYKIVIALVATNTFVSAIFDSMVGQVVIVDIKCFFIACVEGVEDVGSCGGFGLRRIVYIGFSTCYLKVHY